MVDVGEEEQTACCDQTAAVSSSTLARPPDTSGSCSTHSVDKNQGEVPVAVMILPFETRFLPNRTLSQEVEEKLPSFWLLVLAYTDYEKRNRGSDVFVPKTKIPG